jgi:leader peptidase (prepilin peptidase) / N-methyltransferase
MFEFDALMFLGGLLIGSFMNVCIYRFPRDLSVVRPRSHCPNCRRTIAWYDNVPVLSWLLLRGQCRHCLARIPWSYAAVELATGLAYLLSAIALGPTITAVKYAVFSAMIIALIVTDLQDRILPDELTLGGTIAGLALAPFASAEPGLLAFFFWHHLSPQWMRLADAAFATAAASGLIWVIPWLYQKVRHREGGWMGLGDVKMMAMIGAFLGLRGSLFTMFLGGLLGSVVGYGYIYFRKKDPSTYELPFGSFLGVAALAVAVWGEGMVAWYGQVGK